MFFRDIRFIWALLFASVFYACSPCMSVKGIRVVRTRAEELRRLLTAEGAVDTTRGIIDDAGFVIIPLAAEARCDLAERYDAAVVEREFPPRPHRVDPIVQVREALSLPPGLERLLPSKWEQLGDVLLLRLPGELDNREEEVAAAYASVLGAKSVLRDEGGIRGDLRTPVVRLIHGRDAVTVHRENGVAFKFDVSRLMFSSGNVDERVRVAGIRCDGEQVVDMFAGIGYFSIPLAVHQRPGRVIACELNPVSYEYLVQNITLNRVEDTVEPVLGDNRSLEGESVADRIFMGYVKTTHEYLDTAFRLIKDGGTIHYHETCPCELLPDRPVERLRAAFPDGNLEVLSLREVKSYSPGVSHIVVDARVFKDA